MSWRRLGLVYAPDGTRAWARSHAALPVAVPLGDDLVRVFFSARDADNRSSVGWIDLALADSVRVTAEGKEPLLTFGPDGQFDDSGVGIGSIVGSGQDARLYYMGWNLGVRAPWRNSIGLAVGDPRVPRFARRYAGPVLDRSPSDPYTLSYPWVLRLAPEDWRMWYGSNTAWGGAQADMQHVIKLARSRDGLRWEPECTPAIGFSQPGEYALARPCIHVEDGRFHAWFATRGERYRIGAAVSADGFAWERCDERMGLMPGGEGWDGEMVCYPCVFRHRGTFFMAYNGNAYGRDGFGLAVWEGEGLVRTSSVNS
jgi:hypothetical protein